MKLEEEKSELIEESKEENAQKNDTFAKVGEHQLLQFIPNMMRVGIKDDKVTIYPIRAVNSKNNHQCYSFLGIPRNAKPHFLPEKAKELGLIPSKHFKFLTKG